MKIRSAFLLMIMTIPGCLSVPAQVITTVAGNGVAGYSGDGGPATNAAFNNPISVALDAAGNMYVSDHNNARVRKIDVVTGIVTTIAGTGVAGFSGDGGPAVNAQVSQPSDLCVDAAGNVYFDDDQNFRVRKINAATGVISTVAGNGTTTYAGELVLAVNAGIYRPEGITVDANNLYISLPTKNRIVKVELASGYLYSIAGTGVAGFSGDGGPAFNASFDYPDGLSVTATGEIYVADFHNHRIRKINAAGIVTTVAGNGTGGFTGDGVLAISSGLYYPTGVFADNAGNIFIADRNNHRVRKVTAATGIISTVAGSGVAGFGGDGGDATSPCTKLTSPQRVRMDAAGNLFIADQGNLRVRKVDTSPPGPTTPTITISTSSSTICAGSPVIFSAVVTNAGVGPVYQWKKNGINTGTNSPVYSTSSLVNGDIITCELVVTSLCGTQAVASNAITMIVNPGVIPTITISTTTSTVCQGSLASFTAVASNGGSSPSYQWQVNGANAGINSPTFTSGVLSNGDIISCILTSNASCASPASASSNNISITVNLPVTPGVSITASTTTVCPGSPVSFNAATTNSGSNPSYQWKINSVDAGTNSPTFTSSSLQNGDAVSCSITVDPTFTCVSSNTANSNQVVMTVGAGIAPSVTIVASGNNFCPGTAVTFTATPQNAGANPAYAWKLNGNSTGTNNAVYTNNNLSNGDQVLCLLTAANISCPATVSSNIITITVSSYPVVSISPANATVSPGSQVQLNATVSGSIGSYQWSPAGSLVDPLSLNPLSKPLNATTIFSLLVTNAAGCTQTAYSNIKVYMPLEMPNAFAPAGVNNIFRIPPGVTLDLSDFSIYDRWGNCVFKTTDISKGWDGKYKGKPYNTGVFAYVITGTSNGNKVLMQGSFTLIR